MALPPMRHMLPKKKNGRPRTYDPEVIAAELLEWSKDEFSINFAQFCADHEYLPTLIWQLEKSSEEFRDAYIITKMRLAERRERLMNEELLNYGSWNRYQRNYDPFLAKDEDEKEDKDAARKMGIVQAQQSNLANLVKLASNGEIKQKD